jgi:hypothetical protein
MIRAPLGMYKEQFNSLPGIPVQVVDREIAVPLQ